MSINSIFVSSSAAPQPPPTVMKSAMWKSAMWLLARHGLKG
jgi:hypothetical protein